MIDHEIHDLVVISKSDKKNSKWLRVSLLNPWSNRHFCEGRWKILTLTYNLAILRLSDDAADNVSDEYSQETLDKLSENRDKCKYIEIYPDTVETVNIEGLHPCTKYVFTMYTNHLLGDKREVREENIITEMTKCTGKDSSVHQIISQITLHNILQSLNYCVFICSSSNSSHLS